MTRSTYRLFVLTALLTAGPSPSSSAAEPAACSSSNPADWPAPSKPYFMLAVDTSGSMDGDVKNSGGVAVASSCGLGSRRIDHLRCALRSAISAYSGQVNFGLATFPRRMSNCGSTCYTSCSFASYPNEDGDPGCGPGKGSSRRGAFIRVPMLQDAFWSTPPPADNTASLLGLLDNNCAGNNEIFANGFTPLAGMLYDLGRYFSSTGWTAQDNSVSYASPLHMQDHAGAGINGGTACRSVNILLVTDGDDTCDSQLEAVTAAATLYADGVSVGGKTYKIRTYVINFVGASAASTDAIASAGGTGGSVFASNEAELAEALSSVVAAAARAEVCDNADNNCNGCTDEGTPRYCHVGATCCTWGNAAQRKACLDTWAASVTLANPSGNVALLPCTTITQAQEPATWLCQNPGDVCDNVDNNCVDGVDEGVTRCGSPAHCPEAEFCNGDDDDCDGSIDEGDVCAGCSPTPEVCDGCDNDCDGAVDEGVAPAPCGFPNPDNCSGTATCIPQGSVAAGSCTPFGGKLNCDNAPTAEVCDNADNDCDGVIDDDVPAAPCLPIGTPPTLAFDGTSQCRRGTQACGSTCTGFVGPSAEVCDGIDNDCDGSVDEGAFGVNATCGTDTGACESGVMRCENGAMVCQGGVGPAPEICDGIDNDCDGVADDAPLADAPSTGGCWSGPGNCCTGPGDTSWCPPPGATCDGVGSLQSPCHQGLLTCDAGSWTCRGGSAPSAEVCDGLDNDCSGAADDGPLPDVGGTCGLEQGQCVPGALECLSGQLACNATAPTAETCNGLDDDCDGDVDEALPEGGACLPAYDAVQFPGPRESGRCRAGRVGCADGAPACRGGVAPAPEVCNGLDDDCDGLVDEAGTAPDGIDGSVSDGVAIGGSCGDLDGACEAGTWSCVDGAAWCDGEVTPRSEICNGIDDDCDAEVDEASDPALCSPGQLCVAWPETGAICVSPCPATCAFGEACGPANASVDGASVGDVCLPAPALECVDGG